MAGLTTKEAIHQLKTDIELVLKEFNEHQHSRWSHLKEIFTKSSENLLLTGIAYTLTLLYSIFLIIIYFIDTNSPQSGWWLLIESFLLISMLVANFFISFNEDQLRRAEIPMRTRHVVDQLNNVLKQPDWTVENYPHLCAPISPCVTLQWVYRDGKVVNLPWALLTKGDVIIMRPGQEAPGLCESLTANGVQMTAGQIYQPAVQDKESFNTPRIRSPYKSKEYRLLETPYIANLRLALTRALKRPITVFNKQRYLCTIDLIEGITLPFVITLTLISCVVYQFVYPTPNTHWSDVYLLQTMSTSIPLLLVVFLIFWVVLNSYGLARFKQISQIRQKLIRPKSHSLSEGVNDPLIEALSETNLKADQLKSLGNLMYGILAGKEDMVTRTTNIVHVLGSISALCCVDKKGILSWPNPTAEKVFFLRNSEPAIESKTTSKSSLADSMCADNNVCDGRQQATVAEVLDLTHDKNAAFSVEFDDSTWHWHIGRLKPLGLATLLNTCTNHTALHYSDLCAHLTCEALLNEDLVPVTNRRCLCELAKQIGFKEKSTELYTQVENVSVFRRLHSESVRRETRFARSLQLSSRVKVPLPHMLSVIVRDPGGQLQMLTQGTADIILDSCLDYWNGDDLTLLTPADRKKALDFYQRNSLTAYCTAFSYKPLTHSISNKIANHYLELPPECNHMHPTQAAIWPENTDNVHFHSTDSLLYSDTKEEEVDDVSGFFDLQSDQIFLGMVTMQYQAQSDMVELIERLERSCVRFVHFSKENELRSRVFGEKMGLESGWNCHISLLSEPQNGSKSGSPETSKRNIECSKSNIPAPPPAAVAAVTSSAVHQKMAFRCYHHPEFSNLYASGEMARMKMLSTSAPGAIHLDHNIVKFYNDKPRHSVTAQDISKHTGAMVSCESEHSMVSTLEESGVEGCRSLSCLTDSTDHSAPVNFDMSNTAKLPRGIENIRPHIERIDNVPLLVSLFTDCTANSARQMMEIMQDYGEVVCVLASSANKDNMEIFMQADASIGMEPLYPVLCQKLPPYSLPAEGIGPICLARALNSVPCSLSMTRDTDISLFSLITMSRHFMLSMWNATQYWLCSVCAIALLQCICVCTNVPVCLTLGGCMLLCWLYVSCLAISLATSAPDANVMQSAATKHITHLDLQTFLFVYWCYGLRFIPSVISIYIQYSKTLEHFCKDIVVLYNSTSVQCNGVYPTGIISLHGVNATVNYDHKSWNGWGADLYDGYFLAQNITQILVTIHFVVISMSFVHRDHMCWQKCFWTNKVWVGAAMFILVTQSIWSGIMLNIVWWSPWQLSRYTVTWQLQLAYILSPCILYFINEVIKFYELRVNDRYQKRARLDFGTKLGMNSPFPG